MFEHRNRQNRPNEILARIALMSGLGFGVEDISIRLRLDCGIELRPDAIQVMQAELGLVKLSSRQAVCAKLAERVGFREAEVLSVLLWDSPGLFGIELGRRSILVPGERHFQGTPRSIGTATKAGFELWKMVHSRSPHSVETVRRLVLASGLTEAEVLKALPEAEPYLRRLNMVLPKGRRPRLPKGMANS